MRPRTCPISRRSSSSVSAYVEAAATLGVAVAVIGRVLVCPHTRSAVPATVAALAAAGAVAVTIDVPSGFAHRDQAWLSATIDSGVVNRAWVQFDDAGYAGGLSAPLQSVSPADAKSLGRPGGLGVSPASLRVALVGVDSPGYRSLALGYVRAYAQADARLASVAFTTIDCDTTLDPWWVAYRILGLDPRPDIVAFSVVCWNARHVYEAIRIVKTAHPEALIVLGGPEVGPIAEDVLASEAGVDAVVRGEGEVTFAELVSRVADTRRGSSGAVRAAGTDLSGVTGVTSRWSDRIVSAPNRPLIEDLDDVPSPYLSGVMRPVDGATYLETYRGCPHACAYCFEGKGYGRLRRFSDERVSAEIDLIGADPAVRSFSFIDPVFNLTAERLEWLSERLSGHADAGVRLHTVEVDVERIGPAEAALLRRAGVASVETGPQSVGRDALEACHRAFDRDRFAAGVSALKTEGISVECDLIVGLPRDTPQDVLDGLEFTIGLDPGAVQISTLHVLPGTELWQRAAELGVRYDPVAPHEVVATKQMSFHDLRRLEVLGTAAAAIYKARS